MRKCPGYRFAELEMALVAVEILSRFRIKIEEEEREVKPVYGFITKPDREERYLSSYKNAARIDVS